MKSQQKIKPGKYIKIGRLYIPTDPDYLELVHQARMETQRQFRAMKERRVPRVSNFKLIWAQIEKARKAHYNE